MSIAVYKRYAPILVEPIGAKVVFENFHRPHPSPMTDKDAVASLRDCLHDNGVKP